MSKTIEDYRNIVKILKLQLLKVREQNISLSNTLGISSQTETSSFSPRINNYKQSKQPFAKNMLLFTNFAHRCQLIGVTPEMIFRIADKKRDKKISTNSISQIMKRLKLKLDDVQIHQLCSFLTKSGSLHYEQYLQFLSAFQINSEKYPFKGQRTYTQLCLLKYGEQAKNKDFSTVEQLFQAINPNDKSHLSLEDFTAFVNKYNLPLKEVQIVSTFVGLDIQGDCEVTKQNFRRQYSKVYSLLEKGVRADLANQQLAQSSEQEKPQKTRQSKKRQMIKDQDGQLQLDIDTGVEAGNKKKPETKAKPVKAESKLGKGDFSKVINELKKDGVRVEAMMNKLFDLENKATLLKPFSLFDFHKAIKQIKPDQQRKKTMELFKILDSEGNGSVSTQQLIKLWLRARQISDTSEMLFRMLYRHLREIQYPQPQTRFGNLGYNPKQKISKNNIEEVFSGLNFSQEQIKEIIPLIGDMTIEKFADTLKNQGKAKSRKQFKKMQKSQYTTLNQIVKKLIPKEISNKANACNFKRLTRLQEDLQNCSQYWETIFTDEWKCFQYCLNQANSLTKFWRDHQFGPTKGDPHGYRSIVGNESDVPPGLPSEQDIEWMTFQQMLAKQQNRTDQVILMDKNLMTTDVMQGKIGNCWLVSSLSIIANNDQYIIGKDLKKIKGKGDKFAENFTFGIFPQMFRWFNRYGLYVFKFFKQFKPVYIIVDDLFPVQTSSNQLIFAHSPNPGLQWVAFVEKAYAKLHHSYTNLVSGDISQGLNDLTNALPIKESLTADNLEEQLEKLMRLTREQQLLGCSISPAKGAGVQKPVELDDQRCGLFYGHAYSISDMIELKTKQGEFKLIRVRNPWGHGQWILDWSQKPLDDDPDYKKLDKYMGDIQKHYEKRIQTAKKQGYEPPQPYEKKEDGQFLMNFEDFLKIYTNLFTGLNFDKGNRAYNALFIKEKWDKVTPSGICKMKGSSQAQQKKFIKQNHQYILQVKKPTDILLLVIQQDGRLYRGQKYPYKELCNAVIILVFKLGQSEQQLQVFDKEKLVSNNMKLELRRDVDFWSKLDPGRYAIIPCKMKNNIEQSEYEFRIYSDQEVNIRKIKNGKETFKALSTVQKKYDLTAVGSMVDALQKLK